MTWPAGQGVKVAAVVCVMKESKDQRSSLCLQTETSGAPSLHLRTCACMRPCQLLCLSSPPFLSRGCGQACGSADCALWSGEREAHRPAGSGTEMEYRVERGQIFILSAPLGPCASYTLSHRLAPEMNWLLV